MLIDLNENNTWNMFLEIFRISPPDLFLRKGVLKAAFVLGIQVTNFLKDFFIYTTLSSINVDEI